MNKFEHDLEEGRKGDFCMKRDRRRAHVICD